jgi:hypothetical protein
MRSLDLKQMDQLLCECGHPRCWHDDGECEDEWTGYYCKYPDCPCVDFRPGDNGETAEVKT